MKDFVLVTYLYSGVEEYLEQFIESVNSQIDLNFEVIFFNDNLEAAEDKLAEFSLRVDYRVKHLTGSIAEIRLASFKHLAELCHSKVCFQDIDDLLSTNRVAVSRDLLDKVDIVCNDLCILGSPDEKPIWSERLIDLQKIRKSDLLLYNVLGLGNTAIRSSLLRRCEIKSVKDIKVFDWLFYYQLLEQGCVAIYTDQCLTFYRQHERNLAGIRTVISPERFEYVKQVKLEHYSALEELGYGDFKTIREQIINKKINEVISLNLNLFWWEETNII